MAHNGPDFFEEVTTRPRPIDAAIRPVATFAKKEAAGGVVLVLSTIAALILANTGAAHAFHELLVGIPITLNVGSWVFPSGKHAGHIEWWINDALMAAFFFVIGLEIKREFLAGELREPRKAALPLIGAVGGMLAPGLIYAAFNYGSEAMRGWAIPTATDIAFALGVLALLGRRVPPGLRLFLVTLAIADDLGALLIIAIFYTKPEDLSVASLGLSFATMGVMFCMNFLGVRRWWIFGLVGILLWYFVLLSGVHATIAGVMGAMTIPVRTRVDGKEFSRVAHRLADEVERDIEAEKASGSCEWQDGTIIRSSIRQSALQTMEKLAENAQTPLQRLERGMVPLAVFFVVPVFALANAGVSVGGIGPRALGEREAWGIVLGLVAGKTIGIFGASYLAVRLGLSSLPQSVTWRHMFGASLLGGIGFTMSLFIAHLAFGYSDRLQVAKLAVLTGSVLAAVLGAAVLLSCRPMPKEDHP